MLAQLFCICFFWPALLVRFGLLPALTPRPRPLVAPRAAQRQWRGVGVIAGRLVAVRVQLLVVRGVA